LQMHCAPDVGRTNFLVPRGKEGDAKPKGGGRRFQDDAEGLRNYWKMGGADEGQKEGEENGGSLMVSHSK